MITTTPVLALVRVAALMSLIALGLASLKVDMAAACQVSTNLKGTARDDVDKAKLLGVLTYTCVTVNFEEVPIKDALKTLGGILQVRIAGRYDSEHNSGGLHPYMLVTINADQRFAVDILEEMLEQCAVDEPCTWQLRFGAVEVGSKRRLAAAPSARETRTYELTDLLIEPPRFGAHKTKWIKCDSPYVEALLGARNRDSARAGPPIKDKDKSELMLELVEGIIELIEPGHWDLGGKPEASDDPESDPQYASPSHIGSGARTNPPPGKKPTSIQRNPEHWASMRAWQEGLIITAPDFMHRQLGGYPKPIPPDVTSVVAPLLDSKPVEQPKSP